MGDPQSGNEVRTEEEAEQQDTSKAEQQEGGETKTAPSMMRAGSSDLESGAVKTAASMTRSGSSDLESGGSADLHQPLIPTSAGSAEEEQEGSKRDLQRILPAEQQPTIDPNEVAARVANFVEEKITVIPWRKGRTSDRVGEGDETGAPEKEAAKHFWERLWFKRTSLVLHIGVVAYLDIGLDMTNARELFVEGFPNWGKFMLLLLIGPNILTWSFLNANGVASLWDLPIAIFQLGPLVGIMNSFEKGEHSADLVWYAASEGLIESPMTGMLTAYIMTFGGVRSPTFKFSMVSSFVAIANKAVMVNFYGKKATFFEKANEFTERFFGVALRITSLACFGYLMKESGEMGAKQDMHTNSQTALVAWVAVSFATNVAMVRMAEPKCPISVSTFFGIVFIFTPPPAFLSVFAKMKRPFIWYRRMEIVGMITIAMNPLKPNPRMWDLLDQAPFLVEVVVISAIGYVLHFIITSSYQLFSLLRERIAAARADASYTKVGTDLEGGSVRGSEADKATASDAKELPLHEDEEMGHEQLVDADDETLDAIQRTEAIQAQLKRIVSHKDVLMTNLFVNLQGASLRDPKIILAVLKHWTDAKDEASKRMLEQQGMPKMIDYKSAGIKFEDLDALGYEVDQMRACGFTAADLKERGATVFELKEVYTVPELADAGFSVSEMRDVGLDAHILKNQYTIDAGRLSTIGYPLVDLKEAGFRVADLRNTQFSPAEIKDIGFSLEEMKEGGFVAIELKKIPCSARELTDAGFTVHELKEAGFDAGEMKGAGFTALELRNNGYEVVDLRNGDYKLDELKAIPISPVELRNAGYTAKEFNDAGYTVQQATSCGFSLADLRKGEYGAGELKTFGFTVIELHGVGYPAKELKEAGFGIRELKRAEYTPKELMEGGYQKEEMKKAGFRLSDIKEDYGLTVDLALDAGFTAEEMYKANFDVSEMLKNSTKSGRPNFYEDELLGAGYSEEDIARGRSVYVFTVGQEVECLIAPDKWQLGDVMCIAPLKVKKRGDFWAKDYKAVRPAKDI